MDDQPNTQAEPVRAMVIAVPRNWLEQAIRKHVAVAPLVRVDVIDFYREDKTQ